jgi:hypothetical protein
MKKFAMFVLAVAVVLSSAAVTAYASGLLAEDQPAVGQTARLFRSTA